MTDTVESVNFTDKSKKTDYLVFATIFMVEFLKGTDFARHAYSVPFTILFQMQTTRSTSGSQHTTWLSVLVFKRGNTGKSKRIC